MPCAKRTLPPWAVSAQFPKAFPSTGRCAVAWVGDVRWLLAWDGL